ncbi:MAG: NDP-sugar synthase, partial [Candidatus Micrarchaeales archaeon]
EVPKIAILMSGGEGTRLRPITYEIPKPLVPIQGKPTLEHIIDELFDEGVNEVVLTIGYKAEKIKEHFSKGDRKHLIDYSIEEKPLGTGGAMRQAFQKIKDKVSDNFMVVNGDSLIDINLKEMYALHKKHNALVTIAVKHFDDVTGYGVCVLDGDRIKLFAEKPDPKKTPSHMVNIGIYIVNKRIMDKFPKDGVFSFERDFLSNNTDKETICAYLSKGQFWPTDTMERYETAIFNWKDRKTREKK